MEFGLLTVLHEDLGDKRRFVCRCSCGVVKSISKSKVKSGNTRSCGCFRKAAKPHTTHGKCHSKAYSVWAGMKTRCSNSNEPCYKYYGGRGISVCDAWLSFENFHADMGDPPKGYELDRIDGDGNYTKENCRWVTRKVQANNRSNNHPIEYNGVTRNLGEWAEITGIGYTAIIHRIGKKWSVAQALGFEEPPVRTSSKAAKFLVDGEMKTFRELSEKYGVKVSTLKQRYFSLKWTIEDSIKPKGHIR